MVKFRKLVHSEKSASSFLKSYFWQFHCPILELSVFSFEGFFLVSAFPLQLDNYSGDMNNTEKMASNKKPVILRQ